MPEPHVLELRIHGVRNTSPWEMLSVEQDEIRRVRGDELGGFWIEKEPSSQPEVRREAYSWGGLARTGGNALFLVGQVFVQILWLLLLPFGLANLAYWMRRLPAQTTELWNAGAGAATLRFFALALTLLYVATLASVSIDLIGIQCFQGDPTTVCSQLPSGLDFLAGVGRGWRLVILSLVPIAGIVLLYAIARRSRVNYEANIFAEMKLSSAGFARTYAEGAAGVAPAAPTILGSPGFWSRSRVARSVERLHFTAAILLIVVLVAWDNAFGGTEGCQAPAGFLLGGCLGGLGASWITPALLIVAALGLIAVAALVILTSDGTQSSRSLRWQRWTANCLFAMACVLFLLNSWYTVGDAGAVTHVGASFLGLVITPGVILALLASLGIAALGWRRGVPVWLSNTLVLLTFALPAGVLFVPNDAGSLGVEIGLYLSAIGVVVVQLVLAMLWPRWARLEGFAYQGWGGAGPGVVMLLSAGIAMTLCSLLVVGFGSWLEIPVTSGTVAPPGMWRDPADAVAPPRLVYPNTYVAFGIALLFVVGVSLLLVLALAIRHLARLYLLTTPTVTGTEEVPAAIPSYPDGEAPAAATSDPSVVEVLVVRRFAGLLHRGETVLGIIAGLFAVAIVLTLIFASSDGPGLFGATGQARAELANALSLVAISVLSALALAAVAAIVANVATSKERTLGLIWDLVCFLPRAGHPFAPPCYSERVIPEVNERLRVWFAKDPTGNRQAVLSAHSLGAVLAVSCILALKTQEASEAGVPLSRISLLTYGIQLRAYFGRFFPELFGAGALGTDPCRRPALFLADPWTKQVNEDLGLVPARPLGVDVPEPSLRSVLATESLPGTAPGPAWLSLWRRTDVLGFPANGYDSNDIDRGASEYERLTYLKTVATHGRYPEVPQYQDALVEVLSRRGERIGHPPPRPDEES